MSKKKLTITLTDELVERLDGMIEISGGSRSAIIEELLWLGLSVNDRNNVEVVESSNQQGSEPAPRWHSIQSISPITNNVLKVIQNQQAVINEVLSGSEIPTHLDRLQCLCWLLIHTYHDSTDIQSVLLRKPLPHNTDWVSQLNNMPTTVNLIRQFTATLS